MVEFKKRGQLPKTVLAFPGSEPILEKYDVVPIIDGKMVQMGDGHPSLERKECPIHGKQFFLSGYNQCGHDGMDVCLKCCDDLFHRLEMVSDMEALERAPMEALTIEKFFDRYQTP